MAREDLKRTNDYQKKNREELGVFTEWPLPSDVARGGGRTQPAEKKKDKSGAQ
ncbi:hypothetical protein SAMN02745823_02525 [Sporobacter termitidis DSM 10068]|uniref:Uncharacterized protein n=1 Tax=Sporobacter termitidis DSM 10068 TaxID=1123282 RepID=A0A1M5YH33_9FIRM|nr:hypothetical protein [Sporobacter termitidis]SHI11292.1 hypothetical protein SAMN02745823_02525 [Sporobacter termitidis DSM 10068]